MQIPSGPVYILLVRESFLAPAAWSTLPALFPILALVGSAVLLILGIGAFRLIRRKSRRRLENVAAGPRTGRPTGWKPVPHTGEMPVPHKDVAAGPRTGRNHRLEAGATQPGRCENPFSHQNESFLAPERLCKAFHTWLAENEDRPDLWPSFDQLIRETLAEQLGVTHVRCYHVRPGCDTLQTISQATAAGSPKGPSLREGVLGHVATSGREFVADDRSQGPLLDDLAARTEDDWYWVWPIRESRTTIGIVALGSLHSADGRYGARPLHCEPAVFTSDRRQALGQQLSLCWQHVACLERLRVMQQTDQATGVLTRQDFFTLATRVLAESYNANEPVVIATLVIEGLRRLDDSGCWRERDDLIVRLGHVIDGRVRSDDLVGRFADDRFVIFLRRLDSGLGRLIAEKVLAETSHCVARCAPCSSDMQSASDRPVADARGSDRPVADARGSDRPVADARGSDRPAIRNPQSSEIRLRIGLAGSGLAQPSLDELLAGAFEAVERARKEDLSLVTDLEGKSTESECSAGDKVIR
ncbi:MAG: GGDEF domain-containing protein [Phycisphaerae bacterium]|nr:GGDEF domain-containing protein [Phycisphaerae bacterium]